MLSVQKISEYLKIFIFEFIFENQCTLCRDTSTVCLHLQLQLSHICLGVTLFTSGGNFSNITMAPRLTTYAKNRIISLKKKGMQFNAIQRCLAEENLKCSRQAVSRIWRSYCISGNIDSKFGGGCTSILNDEHCQFMDMKLKENNELTGKELKGLIQQQFGLTASVRTVLRARKKIGWLYGKTRYCQMVSEKNKIARLEFANRCLETGEDFENVIFTDETKIQLKSNVRRQCHKKGDPIHHQLRPIPKHPYQVL